jgi:hypothetical protein
MPDHDNRHAWDPEDEDEGGFTGFGSPEPIVAGTDAEPRDDQPPIAVTVDDRRRITGVTVAGDWRSHVAPRLLGDALRDAANEAIMDRVGPQIEAIDPQAEPVVVRRDAPSADGDPTSPVAQSLVAEAMELFARFETELAQYVARLREVTTASGQGEGGGGDVVVTLTAGMVSAVTVDDRWAARVRHTEVAAEALAAFQAAQRAVPDPTTAVTMPPSLARLAELAGDPQALSRQLGLSR